MTEQEFCTACDDACNKPQAMAAMPSINWSDLYAKLLASGISLQKVLVLIQAAMSKDPAKIIAALLDLIPAPTPAP